MNKLYVPSDDPSDILPGYLRTGGGFNYTKWSNPALDKMFDDQDQTLDQAKRKQQLIDVQNFVLNDRILLMAGWNARGIGHARYVKSYPTNATFLFDSRFRWEQTWLER